jgi:hypothetical protein
MIRTTNTANIGLTAPIEAVEGAYTKKANNIEETREQDFSKRDTISTINWAINLLSILLKNKRRHIRSSINILYIY